MKIACKYEEFDSKVKERITSDEVSNAVKSRLDSTANPDEVYTFAAVITSNNIDRSHEYTSAKAIEQISEMYIGKSGICSHDWGDAHFAIAATDIFEFDDRDADNGKAEKCQYLVGYCYTVEEALKKDIAYAIKDKVSMDIRANYKCSICGVDIDSDAWEIRHEHMKGETYDGKVCCWEIAEATDVFELSIVSVPCNTDCITITKSLKEVPQMRIKKSLDGCNTEPEKKNIEREEWGGTDEENVNKENENQTEENKEEETNEMSELEKKNKELEEEIAALKETLKNKEEENANALKSFAVRKSLNEKEPYNDKALNLAVKSIDMDKIKFNDAYEITEGLDEQLEDISYLFKGYQKTETNTEKQADKSEGFKGFNHSDNAGTEKKYKKPEKLGFYA